MKTYPTLIRFAGMGYSHIVEQTASQRGLTEQILDRDAWDKANAFKFGWTAYVSDSLKRMREASTTASTALIATQILLTYETNLNVDSAQAPFAERLAAMIKTIETLGIKNDVQS